jgi:hypothetical protein
MVDAVDSLLNNAVDLYVQAVGYRQIPTSQVSRTVGAGIRQIMPESDDIRQPSPDLWLSGRILPERQDPGQLSTVLYRISAKIAGIPHKWPDSSHYLGICICQI